MNEHLEKEMPFFSTNQIENAYETFCSLCNNIDHPIEFYYNKDHPLNTENVTTDCCYSLLCPICVIINETEVIAHHLFIEKMIYIQDMDDEPEPVLQLFENCEEKDSNQYRWNLYEPLSDYQIRQCRIKNSNYNSYFKMEDEPVIDNVKSTDSDDDDNSEKGEIYYQNRYAQCLCKSCGFKCCANIYMDS